MGGKWARVICRRSDVRAASIVECVFVDSDPSPRENDSLVYSINRQLLIVFRSKRKLLPASMITEFTKMPAGQQRRGAER
jgi:DNA recombination-dependent growth factor C